MNQSLHLLDLISKEKLDEILCAFTEVTGIAAIISDADGQPITDPQNFTNLCQNYCRSTEKGRHKCCESDSYGGRKSARLKKSVIYSCLNAGLLDCGSPIIVGEKHLGNILCGQVLEKPIKEEVAIQRARSIEITDIEGYLKELGNVPIMSRERFRLIVNLMEVITRTLSELALEKYLSQKHSKLYLDKLINSVSDCIISTDTNATISMINEAGVNMFGHEAKKLIGQSILSLFSDSASISKYQKQMDIHLKKREHIELNSINADGIEFPVQLSLSKISYETEENSGYVAVLRDISEEKQVERMKEDLIGMLTHDMGNPILSIEKALQLLVSETLGPLNKSQMEVIRLSLGTSDQLLGMVTDILDIYRSENRKFLLHKTLIDMNKVLEKSIRQVSFLTKDKNVTFYFEPPSPSFKLQGDRNRILRTCVNLLDNAIKYSPAGGEIRVSSTIIRRDFRKEKAGTINNISYYNRIQPGQEYCLVAISDQGFGIPKKHQQNIFDKFFAIQSGDGYGRKGLGLGLTFCKQVIEAHGGFIWVQSPFAPGDSKKQTGCRFYFTLPVSPDN